MYRVAAKNKKKKKKKKKPLRPLNENDTWCKKYRSLPGYMVESYYHHVSNFIAEPREQNVLRRTLRKTIGVFNGRDIV